MVNKKQLKKLFDEKINKRLGVAKSEADTITGLINPFIDLQKNLILITKVLSIFLSWSYYFTTWSGKLRIVVICSKKIVLKRILYIAINTTLSKNTLFILHTFKEFYERKFT